jgi:tight adherence protein C
MDQLVALIGERLEFVVMGGVFVSVVLAVLAVVALARGKSPVQRRLAGGRPSGGEAEADGAHAVSLRMKDEESSLGRALRPIESSVLPTDTGELTEIRKTLLQAGYTKPSAVTVYYTLRLVLAVTLPLIALLLSPLLSRRMSWEMIALAIAMSGLIGMYLPTVWVSRRTASRQLACREGFPDALDMLLVSVEAGLGLDAAINRVGAEIGTAYPILGEHFRRVGAELRAGKSREAALRGMSDAIGIEEVGSLVTLLVQSDMLGTSIAQALRVHADDMRIKRMLKAEEKAHMLPVKMTVPLILGILPPLVLVILTPAIIRFLRVSGGGG